MATSRSLGSTSLTTRPPMEMVPSDTSSRPATSRSAVVFPQPDEPSSTRSSPSAMSRVSPSTATAVPEPLRHPFEAHLLPYAVPCVNGLVRRDLPPHGFGDLLAGRAEPVAPGVAAGDPFLPAQGAYGGAVDDPLDDAGTGRRRSRPSSGYNPLRRCGPSGRDRPRPVRGRGGPGPASSRCRARGPGIRVALTGLGAWSLPCPQRMPRSSARTLRLLLVGRVGIRWKP